MLLCRVTAEYNRNALKAHKKRDFCSSRYMLVGVRDTDDTDVSIVYLNTKLALN